MKRGVKKITVSMINMFFFMKMQLEDQDPLAFSKLPGGGDLNLEIGEDSFRGILRFIS